MEISYSSRGKNVNVTASPLSRHVYASVLFASLLLFAPAATAGPPYVTDDPEPVHFRNWELYLAGTRTADGRDRSGDAPHFEANYGAAEGVQLHLIVPLAFSRPQGGTTTFGLGDIEVGAKYRFVEETGSSPQVGTFPLVELPAGDARRGLGAGHVRAFVPIWLQKSFGKWTTYGGGGYWINPGDGNRNWWYAGWQAQVQVTSFASPGIEVFYQTPSQEGRSAEIHLNVGLILDVGKSHHILLSAGRAIHGCDCDQAYAAYLLAFGP
jgi:hypothetical protein